MNSLLRYCIVALALVGACFTEAQSAAAYTDLPPGEYIRDLFHDGRMRRYRVHIPTSYDIDQPTPVVFRFQAGSHTGRWASYSKVLQLCQRG